MAALSWDQVGLRFYEEGVDRGVLYMPDGRGIAWNGIISVTEKIAGNDGSPIYFDGIKFANVMALGDFSATLKAYTYPDEFMDVEGTSYVDNGLFVSNQRPLRFGLSYRTKIGNDIDGLDLGYKIHVLYNLTAVPSQKAYASTSDAPGATQFEWNITAIPAEVPGYSSTAHLIFDTRYMSPILVQDIEDSLYGDELTDPSLPPPSSLVGFIDNWVIIRITDNLDGTWTAEGPDDLIIMLDATTFQIIQANAVYLDQYTYQIGDTTY